MTSVKLPFNEAFFDEILRIKVAEDLSLEREREHELGREAVTPPQVGHALKNIALGAGAFGLGVGAAGLTGRYLLPRIAAHLSPGQQAAILGSAGLLSMGGALAFRKAMEKNKEMIREQA